MARNIAIYDSEGNVIENPFIISTDFQQQVIDITVAVDNDFDNGSFTAETMNDNVVIKRSGNIVTLIVEPNYSDFNVDTNINFQHNAVADMMIPLTIRQQFQEYDLILEPMVVGCEEGCEWCVNYVSKSGREIETATYRIRENVYLTGGESETIGEEEFNNLPSTEDSSSSSEEDVIPRYFYNPSTYRNSITQGEYDILSDTCKNGCAPLVYVNRYNDDIEISSEEYDNLTLNQQTNYQPKMYMRFDNNNKDVCADVIETEVYEGYAVEGKYDYVDKNGTYYREISAEDYEEYPEKGQSDYDVYQYIYIGCSNSDSSGSDSDYYDEYGFGDVIDFVDYEALDDETKECFRIYRYSSGDFTQVTRKLIESGVLITNEEYEALSNEERSKYTQLIIEDEVYWWYDIVIISDEEYQELDDEDKELYETFTVKINRGQYETLETNRNMCVPLETITPSKYESLPVYGKSTYSPYGFIYIDGEGNVSEVTIESGYFDIDLTQEDYVFDHVSYVSDVIDVDTYNNNEDINKDDYEMCLHLSNTFFDNEDENNETLTNLEKNKLFILFKVKCKGGSYDYVINGVHKYRRSEVYDYETDDEGNVISRYLIENGEEYIAEDSAFKLTKIKHDALNEEDGFVDNELEITSYGWLDSTFVEDFLDRDIFYKVKLSHKDVIGLDATIRIELGLEESDEYPLNELEMKKQENIPEPPIIDDGIPEEEEGEEIEPIEPIEPSVQIISGLDNEDKLIFSSQGGTKKISVETIPEDSAIVVQYTSNIVTQYVIDKHDIYITVPKNKFGVERSCMFKVINDEYPSYSVSFMIKQRSE